MNSQDTFQKWRIVWFFLLALLFISGLSISPNYLATASSSRQSAQEGAQLYQQYCVACHTIGKGDLVGPDLQGVTQRRDLNWLENFIAQPDKVLASGDSIAQELRNKYKLDMPNLGLSGPQVQALLAYLENPDAAGGTVTEVLSGGQPQAGQAFFTGQSPLANGGTPCIACHSAAGAGALGGGILGPDLTQVYGRLGDTGLTGALKGLPFPTMQGVFAGRPLSAQEQADLYAYFQQIDQQPVDDPKQDTNMFWGFGGLGALVLFGILFAFWPRQRKSVSARLRKNA